MRKVTCNTEFTPEDLKAIEEDDSIIGIFHGSNGGVVRIHDNVLRTLTPEQIERNIQHMYDVAREIAVKYYKRQAEEKLKAEETARETTTAEEDSVPKEE